MGKGVAYAQTMFHAPTSCYFSQQDHMDCAMQSIIRTLPRIFFHVWELQFY